MIRKLKMIVMIVKLNWKIRKIIKVNNKIRDMVIRKKEMR